MSLMPRRAEYWFDAETRRGLRHGFGAVIGTLSVGLSVGAILVFAYQPNVLAAAAAFVFFLLGLACKAFVEGHFRFWKW